MHTLFRLIATAVLCLILSACTAVPQCTVFVCDQAVLAYNAVAAHAQAHGACTLVLIDYHNAVRPAQEYLSSINWVSTLMQNGFVDEVFWVSGRTMLLPNRNSRADWLERNLAGSNPGTADYIRRHLHICDWHDLTAMQLPRNTVVHVGCAEFTKDPGDNPDKYIEEICAWIAKQQPELLTLSLSAAYQQNSEQAWQWFMHCMESLPLQAQWQLAAGSFGQQAESKDESRAWSKWRTAGTQFFPGAYNWLLCPPSVRNILLAQNLVPADSAAAECISAWQDATLCRLEAEFPPELRHTYSRCAAKELYTQWQGTERLPMPPQPLAIHDERSRGIAVRFRTALQDRGCLALYGGMSALADAIPFCVQEASHDSRYTPIAPEEAQELFINISIFAPWQPMQCALDFIPGADSLILEEPSGERTLLQSAIAQERGYSREQFLARLSNKAGLGLDGWQQDDLHFYKSRTLCWTEALHEK